MKAVVIGAGIGGIATAIRLAVRGYEVAVFEANAYAGGKLSDFEQDGYRFDAGPSLFTMPQLVDDLFRLANRQPSEYFQYHQLPEVCRYFWDDGTRFTVPANTEAFAIEAEKTFGESAERVRNYLKDSGFKYEVLSGLFLEDSLHKLSTWTSQKALQGYANLHKLGLFSTLSQHNAAQFQHPKLVQLFNRYATYNGSDPYQTPATMSIIPHLEYNVGAFLPKGGMVAITNSLVKLATDLGVKFHFNSFVSSILVEGQKAVGVVANGSECLADVVVSNMDITPTYRRLLPQQPAPERQLRQPRSGSGVIFYWGVRRTFDALGVHNIFFSNDYRTEFAHQFQHKTIYHDPTVYVNITSKYEKNDAPDGSENWFVLINAPANEGQDWEKIIAETRRNVLAKVSRNLGTDIEPLIETEAVLDPRSIELKTSSAQGALYGTSSNNKFAAFLRHANFSNKIKGLYFVGGSVHPGGGIPLALSSARIAAEMIG